MSRTHVHVFTSEAEAANELVALQKQVGAEAASSWRKLKKVAAYYGAFIL